VLIVWIIIFGLLGSVLSVCGAALLIVFTERVRKTLVPSLISYATGTLLGAALIGMLPQALEHTQQPNKIFMALLFGIIIFFTLEKLVIWRHCHDHKCEIHTAAGSLILFGDAFHNFIDGIVITASFLISIPLGVATGLAVIAHEVPQEVGDLAILLESGYSRYKALLYDILSSLTTLPGAVIAYIYLKEMLAIVPYILALSASSFLYIAMSDLIPSLHRKTGIKANISQFVLILAGIGTIALLRLQH
jgi:zinc and cadmium transporter